MPPSAAAISALLLLALAGGFLFAFICEYTRYPSLRGEGQQLYFFAAVFGVVLLFLSRLVLVLASWLIPSSWEVRIGKVWEGFVGPLNVEGLATFSVAFLLGPLAATVVNALTRRAKVSEIAIENYGVELEKFLYDAVVERRLIFLALENRKVYVGWPVRLPIPKPRRDAPKEHFEFLPARSGYLDEKTLEVKFTTQYGPVYERIANGTIRGLRLADFQIVIPLDKVVLVRPYSLDVDRRLFEMSSEQLEAGNRSSLMQTLLLLLMVWKITRKPGRG
jgi:hypothetical protein